MSDTEKKNTSTENELSESTYIETTIPKNQVEIILKHLNSVQIAYPDVYNRVRLYNEELILSYLEDKYYDRENPVCTLLKLFSHVGCNLRDKDHKFVKLVPSTMGDGFEGFYIKSKKSSREWQSPKKQAVLL